MSHRLVFTLCVLLAACVVEDGAAPTAFRDPLADGDLGPEMVPIPPGHFAMGDLRGDGDLDERPVHEVVIGRAFALGRYEVTFDEYERYCLRKGDPPPTTEASGAVAAPS